MEIIEGIARALYVSAWATEQEENGEGYDAGIDLMDQAPETTDAARFEAWRLIGMLEQANGLNIHVIVRYAAECDGIDRDTDLPEGFENDFGHYIAMESMGTGVAWTDNHAAVKIGAMALIVPNTETPLFDEISEGSQ